MNAEKIISSRTIDFPGGTMGMKKPVHPNSHVNMLVPSKNSFPTVMDIAAVLGIGGQLLPSPTSLGDASKEKSDWLIKSLCTQASSRLIDSVLSLQKAWPLPGLQLVKVFLCKLGLLLHDRNLR
jgi:fumarate hydratase class II